MKIKGLRWFIIILVFLITVENYIDRMTLGTLAPKLMEIFEMSNVEYSRIVFMFLLAYTISQSIMGRFLDKVGNRIGFPIFISIWAIASALHATAKASWHFGLYRFLLGLGEGGNWPGAAKVVSEWFPARERAFAMAIFNSGAAIGSVVAPPLIVWIALKFGFKYAFLIGPCLAVLIIILWTSFYRAPEHHPLITDKEKNMIISEREKERQQIVGKEEKPKWRDLLKYKPARGLIAARFITDPVWWFYISWLPNYLKSARNFSLEMIGALVWIPFLAADLGNLTGGGISSLLIKKGWSVDKARKTVMLVSALLMPIGVISVFTKSDVIALAAISVAAFSFQSWIINVITLPSDCFSAKYVGSVAGLGGTAAGLGSMLMMLLVGYLVDYFSYTSVFILIGSLGPLGALALFSIVKKIERVV
jgi:ACS family hexuronate transporter-like MFS transporter